MPSSVAPIPTQIAQFDIVRRLGAGGMAEVFLAKKRGAEGTFKVVVVKRILPDFTTSRRFRAMFIDEAQLATRLNHPNVVQVYEFSNEGDEGHILAMEYVEGCDLGHLMSAAKGAATGVPPWVAAWIIAEAAKGLHYAHEKRDEGGAPLDIVHRDVSPQNIHVGIDGVARVLDFGIAKATNRVQETRTDQIKGKVAYMSPEQLARGPIDRRADVYSASVVLWEALTGVRLFKAEDVPSLVYSIINDDVEPPSSVVPDLPAGLDEIVMKGLDREASNRWSSAREMAVALETLLSPAAPRDIGEWVERTGGEALTWRLDLVQRIERETSRPHSLQTLHAGSLKSPASPIEVSGVAVKTAPAPGSDASVEPGPGDASTASAEHDGHAAADTALPMEGGTEDAGPAASSRADAWSPVGIALAGIAVLVILAGAALLAFRLIQLRSEQAPVEALPAEHSSEPAIGLGVSRTASAAPVPTPTPKVKAVEPKPEAPPRPAWAPTGATANDCDNPFTTDAKGLRHPKPHCFKR